MKETGNEIRGWWGRIVRMLVVGVLLVSTCVQAGYKPVDISDIRGEKRKALTELTAELRKMPTESRECYICEQLGLMFSKDASQVLGIFGGYPGTTNKERACFVGKGGKVIGWWEARNPAHERWDKCYDATKQFKAEAPLVPFKKEVQKVVCNTAKYLLKTMPEEQRWWILAFMGNMVYNDQGPYDRGRGEWTMENGIRGKSPHYISGYAFLDPEGKEHDVRKVYLAYDNAWRWVLVVWRCENLVGSKDILALFPEEVEAMRAHYKERITKVEDEAKAKNDALMVAADEMMSSLPKEKRLARIALAIGLYYLDHREAGCTDGHLNPNTTFILPDGTKHRGEEFMGEAPGLLQQIPHEAILKYYRGPVEQMAREVAKERFKEMPPILRDLLRALLSRQLIELDGSPAEIGEGISTIQTFDREWQVPVYAPVDREHTYFQSSTGQSIPFSVFKAYGQGYARTLRLVNLCAQILGKAETVKLIPPGGGAVLTAEQRHAWLAEKMGFCFTEDGTPAYQSERTANGDAVYVDAQGKVRKLSEVPGKDSAGWTDATSTALAVGYDKFTAPYKEELKQLAVQTSKHILGSMPPGLRQSWLAERNKFFFRPNPGDPYRGGDCTLDSGIKVFFQGSDYVHCLYYDPSGKVVSVADIGAVWKSRWWLLYYCETVVGIEAINKSFSAEVEPMRAAFQKSPFYKK